MRERQVDRTISHFQQDVVAAAETDLCSASESERSYTSSYWPSPTLSASSEASALSVAGEEGVTSEAPTSTLSQNDIMIACANTIKSVDALWQPVLRYEVLFSFLRSELPVINAHRDSPLRLTSS